MNLCPGVRLRLRLRLRPRSGFQFQLGIRQIVQVKREIMLITGREVCSWSLCLNSISAKKLSLTPKHSRKFRNSVCREAASLSIENPTLPHHGTMIFTPTGLPFSVFLISQPFNLWVFLRMGLRLFFFLFFFFIYWEVLNYVAWQLGFTFPGSLFTC